MTLPKNKAVLFLLYNIKFLDVNLDKESERQPYLKEKRVFVLLYPNEDQAVFNLGKI